MPKDRKRSGQGSKGKRAGGGYNPSKKGTRSERAAARSAAGKPVGKKKSGSSGGKKSRSSGVPPRVERTTRRTTGERF